MNAGEVATKLDIAKDTLRAYSLELEKAGYEFKRNNRNQRRLSTPAWADQKCQLAAMRFKIHASQNLNPRFSFSEILFNFVATYGRRRCFGLLRPQGAVDQNRPSGCGIAFVVLECSKRG